MNIGLRDIGYFLCVAETGSLSRAAETWEVGQPAISKAIRRLELELGLTLLERHARGARLSAAGQNFLPVAKNLHAGHGEAQRLAGEMRAQRAGLLRIGVTDLSCIENFYIMCLLEFWHELGANEASRASYKNFHIAISES